jgi:hypothetical protein
MKQYKKRVCKFLLVNGYKLSKDDGVLVFHKSGYSDIEVNDDTVIFISDIGDYAHFGINCNTVFTLIGFMLIGRQLDISFQVPLRG